MRRNLEDHMSRWMEAAQARTGQGQYARVVRAFFEDNPGLAWRTATAADLRLGCSKIESRAMRRKTISALGAFFEFMHDEGLVRSNPARGLSKAVTATRSEDDLFERLRRVADGAEVHAFCWYHVALHFFDAKRGPSWLARLPRSDKNELTERLRVLIANNSGRALSSRLRERVFPRR
jgi:hypothetical protein